jgi:hypothetical protein
MRKAWVFCTVRPIPSLTGLYCDFPLERDDYLVLLSTTLLVQETR